MNFKKLELNFIFNTSFVAIKVLYKNFLAFKAPLSGLKLSYTFIAKAMLNKSSNQEALKQCYKEIIINLLKIVCNDLIKNILL
ncbi:hypothetical protein ER70_07020, partial (plasmid) [Borreliella bissettiae]